MELWLRQVDSMTDYEELISMKEQIKNEVLEKNITWQKRMELYERVKWINKRIEQLNNCNCNAK